ncbi:hypothetical protein [Aegicerativicinus sediminis]|uniref:hypothetical protein n=1 Tax=Aegicerativicinus sediminis TaxID=2893202 RepID=UPI001E5B87C6|nr:hypothetical protein [Aegicerativicinus sediminis]
MEKPEPLQLHNITIKVLSNNHVLTKIPQLLGVHNIKTLKLQADQDSITSNNGTVQLIIYTTKSKKYALILDFLKLLEVNSIESKDD